MKAVKSNNGGQHLFLNVILTTERSADHFEGGRASRTTLTVKSAALGAAFLVGAASASAQSVLTVLHHFGGTDGCYPYGSPTLSGSTLYGTASDCGQGGYGTVFKMNTDGSGFQVLHSFGGSDGIYPEGSLTLANSTLYGTTFSGGVSDQGTVFKINTDGTGFQLLHSFAGGTTDGSNPWGSLTLADSTLYGMTPYGGSQGGGTVFKINTDGTDFQLLHSFAETDGSAPWGAPTLSGSTLYGMTSSGGYYGHGTLFQINTDGSDFQLLHSFNDADGSRPFGSLTLSGSTLFGMTCEGGNNNYGTVFALQIPEPATSTTVAGVGLLLLSSLWRRR